MVEGPHHGRFPEDVDFPGKHHRQKNKTKPSHVHAPFVRLSRYQTIAPTNSASMIQPAYACQSITTAAIAKMKPLAELNLKGTALENLFVSIR